MSEPLRLIITGGTFDKEYDAVRGALTFSRSHLPDILKQVRCSVPIELEINQLIDSLEMGEADRERIVAAVLASPQPRVVITHGTDTMTTTADLLVARGAGRGHTVVLTGAMVPYTVNGSDALFNLGAAVSAAQLLAPGVWIAMHGRIFAAGEVVKDREAGSFLPST